jgi:Flp pilus assembly pilin Flp
MLVLLKRFIAQEDGATAIEYAIIAVMMMVVFLAAWPQFYDGFIAVWTDNGKVMANAVK